MKKKIDEERAAAFMGKIIQISLPFPDVSSEVAGDYLQSLVKENVWLSEVI